MLRLWPSPEEHSHEDVLGERCMRPHGAADLVGEGRPLIRCGQPACQRGVEAADDAVAHPVQGLADGDRPGAAVAKQRRAGAGMSLSVPRSHPAFLTPCSVAARRARASMSGSGSTPATARTLLAIGKVSCPVPQPRSTTTSSLVRLNAPMSASITAGG